MAIECTYSFRDLYLAAYGHEPKDKELKDLYSLPQEKINETVKDWAELAGWETKERKGTNRTNYLAFAPSFDKDII